MGRRSRVLGQVLRLSLVAIGVGVLLAAGKALAQLLYGVGPTDPLTIGGVTAVLGSVALIATGCPHDARAASID